MNDLASLEKLALGNFGFNRLLTDHIQRRFAEKLAPGHERRRNIQTQSDLITFQKYFRLKFGEILGGLPPVSPSVSGTTVGRLSLDDLQIEKILIPVRQTEQISCHLYRHSSVDSPRPGILFLCGHTESGAAHPLYQKVCQVLARAGLVVLAVDPIGQGERISWPGSEPFQTRTGYATDEHVHLSVAPTLRGENLLRYMIHDNQTALTWLAARPDVDSTRLGVTGNSGGGLQSAVLAALDDRIRAVAPGTWLNTMEWILRSGQPQDSEQVWHGYVEAGFNHHDLVLAACPRPYLLLVADFDFFPLEGCQELFRSLTPFWDNFGRQDDFQMFREASAHTYSLEMAKKAATFFATSFGISETTTFVDPAPFSYDELRFFPDRAPEDHVPEWAVFQTDKFSPSLEPLRKAVEKHRFPIEPNLRYYRPGSPCEGLWFQFAWWWVQKDLVNFAFHFRKAEAVPRKTHLLLWEGGTSALVENRSLIEEHCDEDSGVCVLDLSGMGRLSPAPLFNGKVAPDGIFGDLHICAENLSMLGDDLFYLRLWELCRFFHIRSEWPMLAQAEIELFATGNYNLMARLAASLNPDEIHLSSRMPIDSPKWLTGPPPYPTSHLRSSLACGLAAEGK